VQILILPSQTTKETQERMMQEGGWTGTLRDEEEELFDMVDNIADLTMEHIKRHLSISESSNADTGEENSVNEDIYSTMKKRFPLRREEKQRYHMAENGDIYSTIQKKTLSNIRSSLNHSRDEIVLTSVKNEGSQKKSNGYPEEDAGEPIYATIDKKTTLRKLEEDCYSDEEDELMAHIEDCEDLAMEALDTAAVAVTGMIKGETEGSEATRAVVEAAKAVAALATAAEENIEVSTVVKEVQARLQGLQEIQAALSKQRRPPRGVKVRNKGSPQKIEKEKMSSRRKQKQVRFEEEQIKPKSKVHFLSGWGSERFHKVFREQEV